MTTVSASPPAPPGTGREGRRRRLLELLGCLALVAALAAPAFRYEILNRDEATIATVARAADAGRTLYDGIVDRKPPVVFEVASVVGTDDLRPLRALGLAAVAVTALVGWRLSRHLGQTAGWQQHLILAFCGLALFPLEDGMAAGFELFALPSLALVLYGSVRGNAILVGAFAALAILTKQTALLPVAATLVVSGRRLGPGFVGRAVLAGAVVAAVLCRPYAPSELIQWTFLDGSGYLGGVTVLSLVRDALPGLLRTVLAVGPVAWLAWRSRSRWRPEVVAMTVGAAASVLPGLRFAPHYALFLLVPLLPLCAEAVFARPWTRVHAGLAALVLAMSVVHHLPRLNPATAEFDELAAAVEAVTEPSDEIFVWGQVSTVYWQSDRLPATSFPTTGFATGYGLARRPSAPLTERTTPLWDRMERELRLAAPVLLVDTSGALGVPHPTILESPLEPWVRDHYQPYRAVEGAVIWVRTS